MFNTPIRVSLYTGLVPALINDKKKPFSSRSGANTIQTQVGCARKKGQPRFDTDKITVCERKISGSDTRLPLRPDVPRRGTVRA